MSSPLGLGDGKDERARASETGSQSRPENARAGSARRCCCWKVTLRTPKTPPGALQTQLVLTTQDGEQLVLPAFGYVTPAVKALIREVL